MQVYSNRIIALAAFMAAVVLMGKRQGHFNREIAALEFELLEASKEHGFSLDQPLKSQQSWDELPPVVTRYLLRVFQSSVFQQDGQDAKSPYILPVSIPAVRSLSFHQQGSFRLESNWYPFIARQTISTAPNQPGFVWEAALSFLSHKTTWLTQDIIKVRVCDALVRGQAYLNASLWGILTLAHKQSRLQDPETDILVLGELLRWLAEAPLYPTVLLPSEGVVTWKAVENEPNQAVAEMNDPFLGSVASILVSFDPESAWISHIGCMRPRMLPNGDFESTPWKGSLSNYNRTPEGFWVPTHMECGWILDGTVELYFKGNNLNLDYIIAPVPTTTQTADS